MVSSHRGGDTVIYKDYLFSHLDDQNITLKYIFGLCLRFMTASSPNPWNLLCCGHKCITCYVDEVNFSLHLRMGSPGCQENQPYDWRVGTFSFIPRPSGKGEGLEGNWSQRGND